MPKPTSTGLIETLSRRIARVRWARNRLELQRVAYLVLAAAAGAGTILLLAALFGSTHLFAVAAWSTLAALAVTAVLLARELRRGWLDTARAVVWIERQAGLGGRLRSLVELETRGVPPRAAFLLPLLAAENVRALARWEPRRLVARRVPRGALALALGSVAVLLAALTLTPVLYPRVPDVAAPRPGTRWSAAREVLDPWRARTFAAPDATDPGAGDDAAPSALAGLPASAQERIRERVWGDAWRRVRDALARAARAERELARAERPGDDEAPGAADDPWQLAERPADRELPAGGGARSPRGDAGEERAEPAARGAITPTEEQGAAGPETAPGAGSGSDPDLYGPATPADDLARGGRFELALVTRMRMTPGGRGGRAATDAAPADGGASPLAASARSEELAHEMTVPRAYEPIVRQVFAHRGGTGAP